MLLNNVPGLKVSADVTAVGTAGAYYMGYLPNTWGEWAALMAGLYSLVQLGFLLYDRLKKK